MRRPALPAPIAAALRESFTATMKDPEFLAEANRRGLDIDPIAGEEVEGLVRQLYATPAETVQRVREIFVDEEMIIQKTDPVRRSIA